MNFVEGHAAKDERVDPPRSAGKGRPVHAVPAQTRSDGSVHVGRQAMYDRNQRVVGYELLFRNTATAGSASGSDDSATSAVIVNTFTEFGFDELVGGRLGFLNLTRAFIVGELPLPFGPESVVLEILESIDLDEPVVAGVQRLAAQGYTIALDDFTWRPGVERLLAVARYVKIDMYGDETDVLAHAVEMMSRCRPYGVEFVAERIETEAILQQCLELGFELFQGYHLRRPQVLSADGISPNHAGAIRLLGQLSDSNVDIDSVVAMVQLDVALSYRLLRIANSAGSGVPRRIVSIRDALVLVGLAKLRAWLVLIALADATSDGDDRLGSVVARARTCELLADEVPGVRADLAFTVGLLHGVAELIGGSLDELVTRLALNEMLSGALTQGAPMRGLLDAVTAHEREDLAAVTSAGLDPFEVSRAYLSALSWSLQMCDAVSR